MKYAIGFLFSFVSFTIAVAQNSAIRDTKSVLTSTSLSNALIVLNGKPLPKFVKSKFDTTKLVDPLTEINPNDIDEVNVIKGDKALAQYGDAGKSGVVEIYTKKSKTK